MKRQGWLVMAAVLALAPLAARADHHPGGGRDGDKEGGKGRGDWMAKKLDLTPDQATRMKAVGEEQRKAMEPLRDALKIKVDELRDRKSVV